MVQNVVPLGLREPKSVLGNEAMIFGEMLGWGAQEAISEFAGTNRQAIGYL